MTDVTLEVAKRLVAAAETEAENIDEPMSIAVMDGGANLVAFHRMDGTLLASVDIARNKAYTAVTIELDSQTVWKRAQPGRDLYGIGDTNDGRIVTFGGGIPLKSDGEVVGGVGVAGGAIEDDIAVAEAAVDAFESL